MLADAGNIPLAAGIAAVVVCSMSLQILQLLDGILDEVARLLLPGSVFVALLPASGPLSLRDRTRYARLLLALRRPPSHHRNQQDHDEEEHEPVGGIPLVPSAPVTTPSTWWTARPPSSNPTAEAAMYIRDRGRRPGDNHLHVAGPVYAREHPAALVPGEKWRTLSRPDREAV